MARIGIYGGSFNPIHRGHIALAKLFLQAMNLDDVWFLVSPQNPFKEYAGDMLSDEKRLKLVQLAIANEPHLIATDYELKLPTPSYTWRTLQALSRDYPSAEFVLLIGADNWLSFDRWYHGQDIIDHYPIAIHPRRHYPIDATTLPPTVTLLDTPLYDISSTEIRSRVHQGLPIDGMVSEEIVPLVIKYYTKF